MRRSLKRQLAALALAGGLSLGVSAPAMAQPVVTGGLVNVTVVDVVDVGNVIANVQVPIGVAANVCGVQAAVLAQQFAQTGEAECTATVDQTATSRAFQQFLGRQ